MNQAVKNLQNSSVIGKLFSRTADNCEVNIPQWNEIISDIINLTQSANVIISLSAEEGAGKTTFLKLLKQKAAQQMDVILVAPTSAIDYSGWLLEAITPWITGGSEKAKSLQKFLADLAETSRPITICIDSNDLIATQTLANDVSALINLADTGNLKLSIVICGSTDFIESLNSGKRTLNRLIYSRNIPLFSEAQALEFIRSKLQILYSDNHSLTKLDQSALNKIVKNSDRSPLGLIKSIANELGLEVGAIRQPPNSDKKSEKNSHREKSIKDSKPSLIDGLLSPRKN